MGDLSLKDLLQLLPGAGLTGALIVFIWAGATKVWVWGYQLQDSKDREQTWKDEARRNAQMAEDARKMAADALTALREIKQEQRERRGR